MQTQQPETSDDEYMNEWSQNDASTDTTDDFDKTSEDGQASTEEAFSQDQKPTSETKAESAATDEEEDIWAGVSDKAKAEFQKTQNEYKAQLGRTRVERERNTTLAEEHDQLKNQLKELEDKNRKPTQFELDHPDYAEEVRQEAQRYLREELGSRDLKAASTKSQQDEESAVNTILEAHADAGDLWNSSEFQDWINEQPQRVANQLNSSNPQDSIEVLTSYKTSTSAAAKAQLNKMSDPKSSSSKPDMRGSLTSSEQYAAEWDTDD